MKEIPLSLCEQSSIINNLKAQIRLDGRDFMEMRPIEVNFGKDYGCCTVSLGETRVLAQVTCEVVEPRPSRPNEGKISIFVHLSPMAAPHFELGKGGEIVDEIQQILDRNIKESRCLDVESLCIMAEESVWQFKVDVTVLNHGGNLGDACNVAAVAALRHFHRPDVTVEEDGRVTIHTHEEKELIPTFLKKIPICLSYAIFEIENECISLIDPTDNEERVMSGKLIIGLNPHGEITSLVFPGKLCLEKHHIMSCVSYTFSKAKSIAESVMHLVEDDLEKRRLSVKAGGYLNCLRSDSTYKKELLQARIVNASNMQVKREIDAKEEPMEARTSEAEGNETTEKQKNADVDTSSDEEFSPDLLEKTLPEVKKEKEKEKIAKMKSKKIKSKAEKCKR